ncbi:MAG: SCO family protein [Longimicrobiales bacterium]|nr:SCO family protein [Longimicrobiales bacterium]
MFRVRKASLYTLLALAVALGGYVLFRGPGSFHGVSLATPAPALGLQAPHRGLVELDALAGDVVVLTFARPKCAPACTPQLATLAAAVDRLGYARQNVRVLVVSLDPAVTPPELLAFVQDHDLGFTGLYGDSTAVDRAARAYRAAAATAMEARWAPVDEAAVPDGREAQVYGIDRGGVLRVVWGTIDPVTLAEDIRTLLRF